MSYALAEYVVNISIEDDQYARRWTNRLSPREEVKEFLLEVRILDHMNCFVYFLVTEVKIRKIGYYFVSQIITCNLEGNPNGADAGWFMSQTFRRCYLFRKNTILCNLCNLEVLKAIRSYHIIFCVLKSLITMFRITVSNGFA